MNEYTLTLHLVDSDDLGPERITEEFRLSNISSPFVVSRFDTPDERRERARRAARNMFAGLTPGDMGVSVANEVADRILAALDGTDIQ